MTNALTPLLAFAGWTLLLLAFTIGVHRWNLILRGSREIHQFRPDGTDGPDWYRRATRAHLNCVENLPVFGSVVIVATLTNVGSTIFTVLSWSVVVARLGQSLIHVSFLETARTVAIRFTFFSVQLVAMAVMLWMVATHVST